MLLNSDLFIGFDGGGTKTICIIGDSQGRIIASAIGASTNLKSRPEEKVKEVIYQLLDELLQSDQIQMERIKGVFVSTAGGDREEDRKRWQQWIVEYGIKPYKLSVANDAVAALAAGTKGQNGIVLIAGTGSIAYSVSDGLSKPIRVGGWGYLIGDEGSGYHIGNEALRMITRSYDGIEDKREAFTKDILEKMGLETAEQLITFIYEDPYPRKLIASIADHVITLAERDEPHAAGIIQSAIEQLVHLVIAIMNKDKESLDYPLVISGGLFQSDYFRMGFEQTLRLKGCSLPIILPKYPPVVGSYMSAIIQSGKTITANMEQNIDHFWRKKNESH
ncbi:hypothetical protein KDN24_03785 [Bacillus sp. Bva_UNVM-123]|uniref:BadF/BadG/BcrA/BcrD ATPase family protein n=1 Tax=Bacillus sp. Bva_UNVM-123 TaxID=2829798 RepID=UPI00391F4475